jgi:hypothetical protein
VLDVIRATAPAKFQKVEEEIMASAFRRKKNCQTWHLCSNCSAWPTEDYEERRILPPLGDEICNECQAKVRDGNCG